MRDLRTFILRRDSNNRIDYELAGMINNKISEYMKDGWQEAQRFNFKDCFGIVTESIVLGKA